ncbi:MAG TPA: RDD family protein [Tepidiformaceae bacterium]|nr:RDD family protein [Tepidiformaceae bacterium]
MQASQAQAATPQPVTRQAARLRYASFESRVAAGALDLLVMFIIGAIFVIAGSLAILISSDFERVDPSSTSINVFWICAAAIAPALLLYFFIGFAWKGQTVGAAVMQLMVIRSDGRRLGVLGAIARVIGFLIYVLIAAIAIIVAFAFRSSLIIAGTAIGVGLVLIILGFIIAAFDARRRMVHDRIAGTVVVRLG